MAAYIEREYRRHFSRERWQGFTVQVKETDVWVGVDRGSWEEGIPAFTEAFVRELREEMDGWIAGHEGYARALVPYKVESRTVESRKSKEEAEGMPEIFRHMAEVAERSGIGPMSAVAGAVAERTGRSVKERFGVREVVVENGGDIYADIAEDMDIAVFAGTSPLSEKVGLHVEASRAPLGICTSSGTVGPSLSFGKADAVMIICRDAALADTYATAYANTIQTADDIPPCMERIRANGDILAAIAVKEDKMGICGIFELKIF